MGAFLYSNKKINTEKIVEVFESRGHRNIISEEKNGETIVYASKILTPNHSYLSGSNLSPNVDDFIIGVGTYFYDGMFGDNALRKVYENLETVLKDNPVYGHWAFVVHKNGKTYVFSDMTGSLRLYVWYDGDTITVTTSLTASYSSITNPTIDKTRLSAFLAGNMGCDGPFVEGIENFNSLKYVEITPNEGFKLIDREIPKVKRIETMEEAIPYVRELFACQIAQLRAIGEEKVSIELTGGLDSRLIASNLKTAGFNYDFLNYPLFGPDKEVATEISRGLNKRLLIQTNIPIPDRIEDHFGEFDFGFDYFRQYANSRWNIENRIQFSGALGECITTPLCVDMLNDTRPEILLAKLTPGELMNDECKREYIERAVNYYVERGFERSKQMTEQELARFEMILLGQLCGDFMYNSGCQAHIYFYNMYVEWHFSHFVSNIAFDVKNRRMLSIALIKAIDPELADYPFVSRRRTKRKSVKSVTKLPLHYFSYNKIKKIAPKILVDFIYEKMGRSFNKEKFEQIDIDYYKELVNVDEIKRHRNLYSDTLNRMYSVDILRRMLSIQ